MFNYPIAGLYSHLDLLHNVARRLQDSESPDLPRDMTDMIIAERGAEANIAVLRTEIEMSRHLLDIIA